MWLLRGGLQLQTELCGSFLYTQNSSLQNSVSTCWVLLCHTVGRALPKGQAGLLCPKMQPGAGDSLSLLPASPWWSSGCGFAEGRDVSELMGFLRGSAVPIALVVASHNLEY